MGDRTKTKPVLRKSRPDGLSVEKIRISVAIPRALRKKLEKLAKVRHVTFSGCVVGLLETAYEDSLTLSKMMDNSDVRHAIMRALDSPDFFQAVGGFVADRQAEESKAWEQQFIPLVRDDLAKSK